MKTINKIKAVGLLAASLACSQSYAVPVTLNFSGALTVGDATLFGYESTAYRPLVSGTISLNYSLAGTPKQTGTQTSYPTGWGVSWIDVIFDYPLPFESTAPSASDPRSFDKLSFNTYSRQNSLVFSDNRSGKEDQIGATCYASYLKPSNDWCFNTRIEAKLAPGSVNANAIATGESLLNDGAYLLSGSKLVMLASYADANGTIKSYNIQVALQSLDEAGLADDVTPVPLPAAAWLFLSGIAGYAGVSFRRSRSHNSAATQAMSI
ncbi:VPLPA-CTERM sorting domain-containing protein [Allohahella sp. A8]|uniref:VPLPA-CTERM sorting domain-containing protein n=1 Tax=Allohahella sp. A8 TaxID=3141461 RepID=UPI003A805DD8